MRSVVVPRGEMRAKYGTEIKAFPYAFVISRQGMRRDGAEAGRDEAKVSPRISTVLASTDGPKSIEVKSRLVTPGQPVSFEIRAG